MLPRRFALVRHVDYTGVSGVGVVAYGVVFADGHVAMRWASAHPATSLWSSLDDLVAVHGHGDATSIEWLDPASDPFIQPAPSRGAGRRARRVQPDPVRPEPVVEPDVTQPTRPITYDPEPAAPEPAAPEPTAPEPEATEPGAPAPPPPPPADPVGGNNNGGRSVHSRLPAQRGTGRHRRRATEPPARTTYQIESDGP